MLELAHGTTRADRGGGGDPLSKRRAGAGGLVALALSLVLTGCQGCGAAVIGTNTATSTGTSTSTDTGTSTGGPGTGEGEARGVQHAQGPAPSPRLVLLLEEARDGFALSLQNRDDASQRVRTALSLERLPADTGDAARAPGQVVDVAVSLRSDCEQPAPACMELAPGAELRPPAFRAVLGDAQCGCTSAGACAALPPGSYRLIATGCDTPYRVLGAPFTLP